MVKKKTIRLGDSISYYLRRHKIELKELAKDINAGQSTLYSWIQGASPKSLLTVLELYFYFKNKEESFPDLVSFIEGNITTKEEQKEENKVYKLEKRYELKNQNNLKISIRLE